MLTVTELFAFPKGKLTIRQQTIVGLSLVLLALVLISITILLIGKRITDNNRQLVYANVPESMTVTELRLSLVKMQQAAVDHLVGKITAEEKFEASLGSFRGAFYLLQDVASDKAAVAEIGELVKQYVEQAKVLVFASYDLSGRTERVESLTNVLKNELHPLLMSVQQGSKTATSERMLDTYDEMLTSLRRYSNGDSSGVSSFLKASADLKAQTTNLRDGTGQFKRIFQRLSEQSKDISGYSDARTHMWAMQTMNQLEQGNYWLAENALDMYANKLEQELGGNISSVDRYLRDATKFLAAVPLVSFILIALLGYRLDIKLLRPLRDITESIDALRRGERNLPLDVPVIDELTKIKRSLLLMQNQLVEIDSLRGSEGLIRESLVHERDKANLALVELCATQQRLVENEKLASLGALVAGVAHEINTPLGVSVSIASTMEKLCTNLAQSVRNGELKVSVLEKFEEDCCQSFRLLNNALARAATLVSNFKQLSVDQTSDTQRSFNLSQLLTEVQLTLSFTLREHNANLVIEDCGDVTVDSYPGSFGQVITNLVDNAIKHGFDGRQSGLVQIVSRVTGSNLELSVNDDGVGISEANIGKVFDPFFTTKLGQGGSGLGLHIVHSIVTKVLGGSISAISTLGQGTTFRLLVPLQAPQKKQVGSNAIAAW